MKKYTVLLLILLLICSLCGCKKDVESISLDKNTVTIERGQSFELTSTILPSDADNRELAWSINGESVNAVTDENTTKKEFRGIKTGKSTIIVVASTGYRDKCEVNVVMNAEDLAKKEEQDKQEQIKKEQAEAEAKIAAEQKAKEEAQYLINGNVKLKLKNTIPATIKQYSSLNGSIVRTYKITKVQADGNAIYVSGTKLNDKFGNEFGCKIKWQLYDDTGAVVESDWTLSPATAVGESWANVNIRFNASSLPTGNYILQFCDSE